MATRVLYIGDRAIEIDEADLKEMRRRQQGQIRGRLARALIKRHDFLATLNMLAGNPSTSHRRILVDHLVFLVGLGQVSQGEVNEAIRTFLKQTKTGSESQKQSAVRSLRRLLPYVEDRFEETVQALLSSRRLGVQRVGISECVKRTNRSACPFLSSGLAASPNQEILGAYVRLCALDALEMAPGQVLDLLSGDESGAGRAMEHYLRSRTIDPENALERWPRAFVRAAGRLADRRFAPEVTRFIQEYDHDSEAVGLGIWALEKMAAYEDLNQLADYYGLEPDFRMALDNHVDKSASHRGFD